MKNRKNCVATTIVFFFCSLALQANVKVNIKDAIVKNLIQVNAVSKGGGIGKCVSLKIKNKTANKIQIEIDAGRRLINNVKSQQDLIITEQCFVYLEPNQTVKKDIYAMCGEAADMSPKKNVSFSFGSNHNKDLSKLALLIHQYKFQTNAGQAAIWAITDNHDIKKIYSNDTFETNTLRRFIANVKKTEYSLFNEIKKIKSTTLYVGFNLSVAKKVSIYILDKEGNTIKEIQNEYPYLSGAHSTKVVFETNTLTINDYDLVVKTADEIVMKRSFKL
ncbi:MAG: hypothetical protein ACK4K9_07755 [Bacteroidia bacterium]